MGYFPAASLRPDATKRKPMRATTTQLVHRIWKDYYDKYGLKREEGEGAEGGVEEEEEKTEKGSEGGKTGGKTAEGVAAGKERKDEEEEEEEEGELKDEDSDVEEVSEKPAVQAKGKAKAGAAPKTITTKQAKKGNRGSQAGQHAEKGSNLKEDSKKQPADEAPAAGVKKSDISGAGAGGSSSGGSGQDASSSVTSQSVAASSEQQRDKPPLLSRQQLVAIRGDGSSRVSWVGRSIGTTPAGDPVFARACVRGMDVAPGSYVIVVDEEEEDAGEARRYDAGLGANILVVNAYVYRCL